MHVLSFPVIQINGAGGGIKQAASFDAIVKDAADVEWGTSEFHLSILPKTLGPGHGAPIAFLGKAYIRSGCIFYAFRKHIQ